MGNDAAAPAGGGNCQVITVLVYAYDARLEATAALAATLERNSFRESRDGSWQLHNRNLASRMASLLTTMTIPQVARVPAMAYRLIWINAPSVFASEEYQEDMLDRWEYQ